MKYKENRPENSMETVRQLPKLNEKRSITQSYC